MSDIDRILVAIDFSAESRRALQYAILLGPSAALTLLHVYELPNAMEGIVPGADSEKDAASERLELRKKMDTVVAEMVTTRSSRIQIALEGGAAVAVILKRADVGNFDLIVMGTHGKTGMRRLLMGSIAEGVVRRAKCPVVTVHLPLR